MTEKTTTKSLLLDETTRRLVRGLEAFAYAVGIPQEKFDAALSEVLTKRFLATTMAGEPPKAPDVPTPVQDAPRAVASKEDGPRARLISFSYPLSEPPGYSVLVDGVSVEVTLNEIAVLDKIVARVGS